jgi:UDP-N-acetylenolpyruvoylglucosamine reductase
MALVRARVADALGVTIEPEVVVWTRNAAPPHKSH